MFLNMLQEMIKISHRNNTKMTQFLVLEKKEKKTMSKFYILIIIECLQIAHVTNRVNFWVLYVKSIIQYGNVNQ